MLITEHSSWLANSVFEYRHPTSALVILDVMSTFRDFFSSCSTWGDSFIIVAQLLNHVQHFVNPSIATLGSSVFHYLLGFAQIHAHWVSDAN